MKIRLVILSVIVVFFLSISSCYYDKKELVYPLNTTPCDTSAVTYSTDIVTIYSANCYSCHSGTASNGAGIKLDTYTDAKNWANQSVSQVETGVMPKGGAMLSSCNIAKIRTWARNGAPNN